MHRRNRSRFARAAVAAAAVLLAGCAPSGGSRVTAGVAPPTSARPAPVGDPIESAARVSDVTVTSARPVPPRASRSRPAPRRAVVPTTQPTRAPVVHASGTATNEQLDALAECESGRDPRKNTGNGFYGAFQFMLRTWHGMGMSGNPVDYSYEAQRDVVRRIPLSAWPRQFPGCSRKLGYR